MEKIITINGDQIRFYVLQVFDEKVGHVNEHVLAIDITNIYYKNDTILDVVKLSKKDFPELKAIYYRVSSDNYNNVYISAVGGKTEDHSIKEINTSLKDYETYLATIASLHSKY